VNNRLNHYTPVSILHEARLKALVMSLHKHNHGSKPDANAGKNVVKPKLEHFHRH
jgi:hypothetical protein